MGNLSYEARKHALIEEIEAAFDGVQRGEGTTFHEGTVWDNGDSPERLAAARAKDSESRWQDVPYKTFRENHAAISFLDPKGFRYYLPALMIWYLRFFDTDEPDSSLNLMDSVIFHLEMANEESSRDYHLRRFQSFTPEESKVVAHFLQFNADCDRMQRDQDRADAVRRMQADFGSPAEEGAFCYFWDFPSQGQLALDKYWGQFLES